MVPHQSGDLIERAAKETYRDDENQQDDPCVLGPLDLTEEYINEKWSQVLKET